MAEEIPQKTSVKIAVFQLTNILLSNCEMSGEWKVVRFIFILHSLMCGINLGKLKPGIV
jgi:hypothetical protein